MGNKKRCHHFYTEEEIKFLRNNTSGVSIAELTDRFNKTFNLRQTKDAISGIKNKFGLKSNINMGRFRKGQAPWNKGLKGYNFTPKNIFKKGRITWNIRPLFSERTDRDGCVYIKIKNPNLWVRKHRYIYEKKYGKISKGFNLIFADGNSTNFEINNLILLPRALLPLMAKKGLYSNDAELTKIGVRVSEMVSSASKLKKKKRDVSQRLF